MRIPKGGIAFFDSGIGGLTVLHTCLKYLKNENIYYYGDNQRAPYGNLSEKKIKKYVNKAFKIFKGLKVKAVIIACNTVTAVCIDELRKKYNFPIIGAEPAIRLGAKHGGKVFVFATKATCNSVRFELLCERIKKQYKDVTFEIFSCDRLAGEIERHLFDQNYDYTYIFPKEKADCIVLGCTHYIYLRNIIEKFYGCPIFDGNEGIAERLRLILVKKEQKTVPLLKNRVKFWDSRPLFKNDKKKNTLKKLEKAEKPRKQKGINTNKCSWLPVPNIISNEAEIYFLGSGKKQNKEVFKHMFAF